MPKIKVSDINMYYEIHGEGYPFVLIMGGTGNVTFWTPYVIEQFSKQFKTIIFDNRGAGQTDAPQIDYTIRMMADDTKGLMDALEIEQAHVLGWSMGGMIAQELALNYPNSIKKLVLFGTYADGGPHSDPPSQIGMQKIKNRESLTDEERLRASLDLFLSDNFKKTNPDALEKIYGMLCPYWEKAPTAFENTMRQIKAILRHDAYERLPKINKPTLIIGGKEDILQSPRNHEILAKRIYGAKLVLLDNVGHGVMYEVPEIFTKMVIEFLKE
jgi:pimeloyl-ACP methyl ester carboxylesterase